MVIKSNHFKGLTTLKTEFQPQHISQQAKDYFSLEFEKIPFIDFTDSQQVQSLRDLIHPIWQSLSDQIPYSYQFEEITINGIRCYQIDPPTMTESQAVILYLHGGSLFFGHPTLCKNIPVSIAHASGIRVVSVEYRLAPEHPMPAQLDDILTVINGLKAHYGDEVEYGLVGHSAGANIGLSAAIKATLKPKTLALIGAFVDASLEGDSIITLADFDPTSQLANKAWHYESFTAFLNHFDRQDPLISPLFADLTELCPTYIQAAGRDRSVSDPIRLNRKLLAQHIPSTLDIWEGMWHGFQMFPLLPEAVQANAATADFLVKHLSKS
jgi:acetyl esterase/lipase